VIAILHLDAPSFLRERGISTRRPALCSLQGFDGLFGDAEPLNDGGKGAQDGLRVPVMRAIIARNGGRICAELVDGKDSDEMLEERLTDAAAGGHDGKRVKMGGGGGHGEVVDVVCNVELKTSTQHVAAGEKNGAHSLANYGVLVTLTLLLMDSSKFMISKESHGTFAVFFPRKARIQSAPQ